jgi:hypothetical protein
LGLVLLAGCRSTGWVERRDAGWNLSRHLPYAGQKLPEPSGRTMLLLRQYDLAGKLDGDPQDLFASLRDVMQREPSAEKLYAFSELAHRAGRHYEATDEKQAFDFFATSVAHAYLYLFDERYRSSRNMYDPQFRGACDLYNRSLDRALRIVNKHGGLRPGVQHTCRVCDDTLDFHIISRCDHLREHEFEQFEFVSDYKINGLPNRYVVYGLGVPLIGIRKHRGEQFPVEKHYPPGLSIPLTAFLRILPHETGDRSRGPRRAVLELYDPLTTPDVTVADRSVPLESDSTTPLAYFLNNLEYTDISAATSGLFRPGRTPYRTGLYMLEPYQKDKIPVVLVHGIWSTPITWVAMFNDLRSIPEIRRHYQFWFYFYPTGQPFVVSAAGLRDELAELRGKLDPQRVQPALDRMVLVGHSMGGLISRLQTVDSGSLFWEQVADKPVDLLNADEATRRALRDTYFFHPNPSIRRVVTIATPHHGSSYSNAATRWLGRKLIDLPPVIENLAEQLHLQNSDALREEGVNLTRTSIDSLAADSPALKALQNSMSAPWVVYHNVVGKAPEGKLFGRFVGESDGVVSVASAQVNNAASQIVVEADHRMIHRHPRTVLEVRRVLLEHLTDQSAVAQPRHPPQGAVPASWFQNIPGGP